MNFQVELSDEQAWALAEFLKRVGWSEWRALAVDDEEARRMRDACEELRQELAYQGYAPR
ncbi:hypothetical protein [Ramlibacter sp.]|uniref:DUF7706 family protein n=1 Tax=Ramlibacter sp. TaxID=1917967 RepID=UPI0017C2B0BF|nr:hypothetical protein [Ramlibacter sp.]MBA2674222.1 hypothetical protein [Ramlibacter sp.]